MTRGKEITTKDKICNNQIKTKLKLNSSMDKKLDLELRNSKYHILFYRKATCALKQSLLTAIN